MTDQKPNDLTIVRPEIYGVIEIPNCGLYAKHLRSRNKLFRRLRRYYDIKNSSDDPDNPAQSWYAHVKSDVVRLCAKCEFCGAYIDRIGVGIHGHCCEVCGKIVMEEFTNGGTVSFRFNRTSDDEDISPEISMEIFGYDLETSQLLLHPTPIESSRWFAPTLEQAQAELDRQANKWQWVEREGQKLIAIVKRRGVYNDDSLINLSEVTGQKQHFKEVKLFQGEEYDTFFNRPPIAESYMIYEAWHWAPLQPTPKLHECIIHAAGMVSRCDYYHQDGRTAFENIHLLRMRLFVEHFTSLNLNQWDLMIARAPRSGPGMIRAIAAFCHPNAQVRNEPNIGNLLEVASKAINGQPICNNEIDAACLAWNDPDTKELFVDTFSGKGTLRRRINKH